MCLSLSVVVVVIFLHVMFCLDAEIAKNDDKQSFSPHLLFHSRVWLILYSFKSKIFDPRFFLSPSQHPPSIGFIVKINFKCIISLPADRYLTLFVSVFSVKLHLTSSSSSDSILHIFPSYSILHIFYLTLFYIFSILLYFTYFLSYSIFYLSYSILLSFLGLGTML